MSNTTKRSLLAPLAQATYQALIDTQNKILYKILIRVRALLLRFCDPLITADFKGVRLTMPFSHALFIIQKLYPHYDLRLHDVAQCVCDKYGRLSMIDVGANIGDTAIFTKINNADYLLIEGEKSYANLIHTNLAQNFSTPLHFASAQDSVQFGAPTNGGGGGKPSFLLYNTFIGDDSTSSYGVDLQDGSGKLTLHTSTDTSNDTQSSPNIRSLDSIIAESNFAPNFIKIDTDGFDFKVLRSATQSIAKYKPALYFEWSYPHLQDLGEDPLAFFPTLAQLGYDELLIFDNFGSPLCVLSSLDSKNLTLLMDYTRDSKQIHYFDVLAFHRDGKDCLQAYLNSYQQALQ